MARKIILPATGIWNWTEACYAFTQVYYLFSQWKPGFGIYIFDSGNPLLGKQRSPPAPNTRQRIISKVCRHGWIVDMLSGS